MKVGIYSLKDILYQGDAASLTCRTTSGEITVLDHHKPLISALASGTMKIVDKNDKEYYIPIQSGFVEVRPSNEIRCIVESAEALRRQDLGASVT